MSLSERVFESTGDIREQAGAYAARAAVLARAGAATAAGRMAAARAPVDLLTEASQKLNTLTYECLSKLLARQGAVLKGTLVEGERRLQRLAGATSLQQALAAQALDLGRIPDSVARNVRETWVILADTGREVSRLATTTYAGLAQGATTTRSGRPARPSQAATGRRPAKRRRRPPV